MTSARPAPRTDASAEIPVRRAVRLACAGCILALAAAVALLVVPTSALSICQAVDPGLRVEVVAAWLLTLGSTVAWWRIQGGSAGRAVTGTVWAVILVLSVVGAYPVLLVVAAFGLAPIGAGLIHCALAGPAGFAVGFAAYTPVVSFALVHVLRRRGIPWRYLGLTAAVVLDSVGAVLAVTAWSGW